MKSEHRHELQTNELAEWIANFPDYVRKNIRTILGITLIAAGIGYYFINRNVHGRADLKEQVETTALIEHIGQKKGEVIQNQMQTGFGDTSSLLISANSLEKAASVAKNPLLAALAFIKQAETLRTELHYRTPEITGQDIVRAIQQAKEAYKNAIEKARGNPGANQLIAMAKFGLGLCGEEVGDFEEAAAIYQEIVANPDFEGTVFGARARFRLDTFSDSREKFVFVKAPVPAAPVIELPGGLNLGEVQTDAGAGLENETDQADSESPATKTKTPTLSETADDEVDAPTEQPPVEAVEEDSQPSDQTD